MPDPELPTPYQRPAPRPQAVAVRYDQNREAAPRVVAKGQGSIAERILALAREHGIPLVEDRDLAELLSVIDIDAEVPPRLYRALAEVLAHLYRAGRSRREAPRASEARHPSR